MNVQDAKAQLSRLVDAAMLGEGQHFEFLTVGAKPNLSHRCGSAFSSVWMVANAKCVKRPSTH
ncbi:MAG: hypothetical protein QE285_12780 [Aquabacterium sp.]|nr:hypothetical protein [Aquabacterium sp.]